MEGAWLEPEVDHHHSAQASNRANGDLIVPTRAPTARPATDSYVPSNFGQPTRLRGRFAPSQLLVSGPGGAKTVVDTSSLLQKQQQQQQQLQYQQQLRQVQQRQGGTQLDAGPSSPQMVQRPTSSGGMRVVRTAWDGAGSGTTIVVEERAHQHNARATTNNNYNNSSNSNSSNYPAAPSGFESGSTTTTSRGTYATSAAAVEGKRNYDKPWKDDMSQFIRKPAEKSPQPVRKDDYYQPPEGKARVVTRRELPIRPVDPVPRRQVSSDMSITVVPPRARKVSLSRKSVSPGNFAAQPSVSEQDTSAGDTSNPRLDGSVFDRLTNPRNLPKHMRRVFKEALKKRLRLDGYREE
jgi:hypothetical protein